MVEGIHVFVSGFVQGVGYRRFIKGKAISLGLKGFVRNLPDRRVEAVFVGDKEDVEKMIRECRKGPFLSEVKNIEVKKIQEKEFEDFKVIS